MNVAQQINQGTFAAGVGEKKAWIYSSQFTVANDANPVILFQSGLGALGGLTRLDQTNFPANGQLPNSQKFEIHGFALEYIGNTAKADADMVAIRKWLTTTALDFQIQDKTSAFQARFSRIMGLSLGLFNDPTTTAEPVSYTTRENGQPFFRLSQKITLSANTNFKVTVYPGVAAGTNQTSDIVHLDMVGELITLV